MSSKEFIGIPVNGKITPAYRETGQRPLEELRSLFEAVVGDETIVEFGWRQYVDGYSDVPAFRATQFWVRTDADQDVDREELGVGDYWGGYNIHPSLGRFVTGNNGEREYAGPDEDRYWRVVHLVSEIEEGTHNEALKRALGIDADITVRRNVIQVDYYQQT